ncbi:MAG: aspartate aminotransferase family protein, partial [Myxococcales bacterium]|nr:aspartate aminotransferase family protein [Myxococcales bacterium]
CHSNGGVFNLGHRNPRVIAALQRALERFDIGNHHLVSEPRARLAAKLAASTDGVLSGVVFGVSGGEANDLALKLARAHTGRPTIVSALGGYHGHTGLSLATGDPQFRDPFGPNLPDFVQLPFNDRAALEAAIDDRTAAVILEPIPATLGMPLPESGYLAYAHELCRQRGALLILDEVQTGLGRTGSLWFYQQEGLTPDILTTGKGLSGGIYPLTATLMRPEIHRFFEAHPFIHVSTFGGAEVGCAVGEEVLAIASDPAFLARVRELAARFAEGFAGAPFELRQRGLFMGLKFAVPRGGMMACKLLYDAGIYTVYAGNDTSVLQFLPALVTDDDEADEIIRRVRKTLG